MTARTETPRLGLRAGLPLLVAAVVGALGVLVTAAPAGAHAELVSSDPAQGRAVGSLPPHVTLTFNEAVRTPAFVEVTAPDGTDVASGDPRIVDDRLTQRLGDATAAGRYAVSYRITSADGHAVSGTMEFTVRGGGEAQEEPAPTEGGEASEPPAATAGDTTPQPSPAAAEDGSGGISTTQLLLLLALLAVGLAAVGIGTRRALRHSATMVDERSRGRSPRR